MAVDELDSFVKPNAGAVAFVPLISVTGPMSVVDVVVVVVAPAIGGVVDAATGVDNDLVEADF